MVGNSENAALEHCRGVSSDVCIPGMIRDAAYGDSRGTAVSSVNVYVTGLTVNTLHYSPPSYELLLELK